MKYIQDEHSEKRRKMDFQRARFLAGFFCIYEGGSVAKLVASFLLPHLVNIIGC